MAWIFGSIAGTLAVSPGGIAGFIAAGRPPASFDKPLVEGDEQRARFRRLHAYDAIHDIDGSFGKKHQGLNQFLLIGRDKKQVIGG